MRHIFIILAISGMLMQQFSKSVIFSGYVLNKEFIGKVFCENREKPSVQCHGKCHLKKQMTKDDDERKQASSHSAEIVLFSESAEEILVPPALLTGILFDCYSENFPPVNTGSVFHPPRV